jgi:DNA processing protein
MGVSTCYWVGFSHVSGIGPKRFERLLDFFGDAETAWCANKGTLKQAGLDNRTIDHFLKVRSSIDPGRQLDRVLEQGYGVLTWNCPEYPESLRNTYSPPIVLYVWGELHDTDRHAVAIIGTRRPSHYGKAVAAEFASGLAANGITVVSGLARGIDSEGHRAALSSHGRTIAVLGSGLDRIYPPENRRLAGTISKHGAIITEYPLGTTPEPGNFPARNRIISGISLGVLVIEAGERSGALITVNFAAEQGREVFAIPGNIDRHNSRGTNRLIQTGAHPVTQIEDILEVLNLEIELIQSKMNFGQPEDSIERGILELLSGEPTHIDSVREACALSTAEVTAAISMLELRGLVRQVGGMHYVRTSFKRNSENGAT